MGDRLTLRKSAVWPTVSLILGAGVVFLVGFLSLHSIIRSYAEPSKAPASQPAMALAGATSGAGGSTVVQTIRITPQSAAAAPAPAAPSRRESRPEPRGTWAMARLPTWLATVDAEAGLGVPADVDPSAPIADTIPRPMAVGLAAVTALALPPRPLVQAPAAATDPTAQVAQVEDVPLPRARPKPPAPTKVTRQRGRR